MPGTLKTVTLGCKVNQYETQYLREGLEGIGFRDAGDDERADLCIVNTCTVTSEGDSKSRQAIRRLHRDQPDARIVVMGCYATRAPDELSAIPGVTDVVTDKRELPDVLTRFGVIDIPNGISGLDGRCRAYVKVQDGCLLRCSYCVIPFVRPEMYSRDVDDIEDEVRRMVDRGYSEVVLTGIHLGHFGVDRNRGKPKSEWVRLAHLLRRLVSIGGDFRIRLSSIEATEITRELIAVMAEFPDRICPHLHVCLQSGSEEILRRMKRRWGVRRFIDRCNLLKDSLDAPALTTDIIVGFPGETDSHFDETLATCAEVGFSKVHAFPFSARQGTPAASLPDQLPKSIKQERIHRLLELEADWRADYYRSLVGRTLVVLVENSTTNAPSDSFEAHNSEAHHVDTESTAASTRDLTQGFALQGTSCRYAPVATIAAKDLKGQLVPVAIDRMEGDRLTGSVHDVLQPADRMSGSE